MKKPGFLALLFILSLLLTLPAAAAGSFEAAAGTPTIDGKKDDAYACGGIAINLLEEDGSKARSGATGTAWCAWDGDYLYVYIDVTDAKVTSKSDVTSAYTNDSAEVYINLAGKDGAIAEIDAAQLTYGPNFTKLAGGGKHKTDYEADVKKAFAITKTGWTVELAIPWGDNYMPKVNAVIPACFAINDDSDRDASTREQHVFAGTNQGNAWSTADASWDHLTLTSKVYSAPVNESANTADPALAAVLAALTSSVALVGLKKRK